MKGIEMFDNTIESVIAHLERNARIWKLYNKLMTKREQERFEVITLRIVRQFYKGRLKSQQLERANNQIDRILRSAHKRLK